MMITYKGYINTDKTYMHYTCSKFYDKNPQPKACMSTRPYSLCHVCIHLCRGHRQDILMLERQSKHELPALQSLSRLHSPLPRAPPGHTNAGKTNKTLHVYPVLQSLSRLHSPLPWAPPGHTNAGKSKKTWVTGLTVSVTAAFPPATGTTRTY